MFYILDLSFLLLSAIEFLRNSAIQVKFIIIIYYYYFLRYSLTKIRILLGVEISKKILAFSFNYFKHK